MVNFGLLFVRFLAVFIGKAIGQGSEIEQC